MSGLLLTGFEPYIGPKNSTQELVRSLEQDPPAGWPDSVALRVFPVSTEHIQAALEAALAETRPRAVLLFGQAPGRTQVDLEERAVNLRDFPRPDTAGKQVVGEPVSPGGPPEYATGLPAPGELVAALRAAGLRAGLSQDAGRYLCNQVFYLARHLGVPAAGFVHVPVLPEQRRPEDPPEACMTLEELRTAALVLVREVGARLAPPA